MSSFVLLIFEISKLRNIGRSTVGCSKFGTPLKNSKLDVSKWEKKNYFKTNIFTHLFICKYKLCDSMQIMNMTHYSKDCRNVFRTTKENSLSIIRRKLIFYKFDNSDICENKL